MDGADALSVNLTAGLGLAWRCSDLRRELGRDDERLRGGGGRVIRRGSGQPTARRTAAALSGVGRVGRVLEGQREAGALLRAVLTATVAAAERRRVRGRAQVVRDDKLELHRDGRRDCAAW